MMKIKIFFLLIFNLLHGEDYFVEMSILKDTSTIISSIIDSPDMYYFDINLGKKIEVLEYFSLSPSVSFRGGKSQSDGSEYIGYGLLLPFMYEKSKYAFGPVFKYINISKLQNDDFSLKNKNNYSLGIKFISKGSVKWFLEYEYLLKNFYKKENLHLSKNKFGLGIRY